MRPHMGYAVSSSNSSDGTYAEASDKILEFPFTSTTDYTRLQTLSLPPISYWHEYLDMVLFYKIVNGLVNVNLLSFQPSEPRFLQHLPRVQQLPRVQHEYKVKHIQMQNNKPSTFLLHTNNSCVDILAENLN